jgi:hypothetical protein
LQRLEQSWLLRQTFVVTRERLTMTPEHSKYVATIDQRVEKLRRY